MLANYNYLVAIRTINYVIGYPGSMYTEWTWKSVAVLRASLVGGFVHGNLGGLRRLVYLVKSFLPTLLRMIQHSFLFGLI